MKDIVSPSNDQEEQLNRETLKQKQMRFVEEGIKTQYSTIFNIGFGPEEVVFMFGNPSIDPNLIRIESKVAVSLKTAKRIVNALGNLIQRYEAANGMLDISAPQAGEKIKT